MKRNGVGDVLFGICLVVAVSMAGLTQAGARNNELGTPVQPDKSRSDENLFYPPAGSEQDVEALRGSILNPFTPEQRVAQRPKPKESMCFTQGSVICIKEGSIARNWVKRAE